MYNERVDTLLFTELLVYIYNIYDMVNKRFVLGQSLNFRTVYTVPFNSATTVVNLQRVAARFILSFCQQHRSFLRSASDAFIFMVSVAIAHSTRQASMLKFCSSSSSPLTKKALVFHLYCCYCCWAFLSGGCGGLSGTAFVWKWTCSERSASHLLLVQRILDKLKPSSSSSH